MNCKHYVIYDLEHPCHCRQAAMILTNTGSMVCRMNNDNYARVMCKWYVQVPE